jgi:hypothetical protein
MTGAAKMADNGCKNYQIITADTAQANDEPSVGDFSSSKFSGTRSRLIVAVSCIVVTVIAVTAILIGIKFFLDYNNDVVTRSFEFVTDTNMRVQQDMTAYVSEREVVHRTRIEDVNEAWTVDDFNRDIRVSVEQSACYVTPVDRTNSIQFYQLINLTLPEDSVAHSVHGDRVVFRAPIADKSLLGVHARRLCQHVPLHWAADIEVKLSAADGSRHKRSICRYICTFAPRMPKSCRYVCS